MKWVTRERPVIDRIACPWLIARFIDKEPEFLFVAPDQVIHVAEETGATPYDVPGVEFTHVGNGCSFDTFVSKYGLERDPAIVTIAAIVRGADTDRHDLTPQSAGLLAISMGLRDVTPDDHEVLKHGFVIYDALYAWASRRKAETHSWPPGSKPTAA
ncbi:MAG: chromate resistance protein [Mesorhizobium sp.]|uniref:chromate resistance protein ChrB domain-containing protein n=1 Tax=Mesorhizobium sp. TaxID=1871066 RepID=UPI00121F1A1E|nr:chromate resistance protein ChrB domain-containing protein [Mesorhizobium sp.]TIT23223.1 MAG: chromate resistance protein [Mesorhizobium sp.]TIX41248.1 MAG: chromate resistance protein [Mesorhizobium sp.]TKB76286.1 MAG: chromate resistance protein [Mesorhizobium sp.]